jgi:hypothetical protein
MGRMQGLSIGISIIRQAIGIGISAHAMCLTEKLYVALPLGKTQK